MKTISKIAAIALVAFAVVGVNTASAATAAELQAQIAQLMQQISALGGTTTTAPAAAVSAITTNQSTVGGMTKADVVALQNFLIGKGYNTLATGYFGPMTKAAVKMYQTAKALPTTGYFGPLTMAAVNGEAVMVPPTTPGTTPTTPTGLTGGAGDLQGADVLSSYSNEEVLEGANGAKVLAIELEADNGSDLGITNIKVSLKQTEGTAGASSRLNQYVESVKVMLGDKEVGSADADDFSESSDVYSKNIALSNAVVKDGEKAKFYVAIDALSNIDSDDLEVDWTVAIDSVRFEDATGAVITDSSTGELGDVNLSNNTADDSEKLFSFVDLTTAGDLEAKFSKGSASPEAMVVKVSDSSDTSNVALLEVKFKAEGSDMTIDNLEFKVVPTGANANEIVKEFKLLLNGNEIDSANPDSIVSGTTTGTVEFTDLEEDIVVKEGDTVTLKVVADINDLEGNFSNGDSILVTLDSATNVLDTTNVVIDDENGDTVAAGDRSGSVIGESQTFYADGVSVVANGTPTGVVTPSGSANVPDYVTYTVPFKVTSFGSAIYVSNATTTDSDFSYTGTIPTVNESRLAGAGTVSGDDTSANKDYFLVEEGDTRNFTYTLILTASTTDSVISNFSLSAIGFGTTTATVDSYAGDLDFTEVSGSRLIKAN